MKKGQLKYHSEFDRWYIVENNGKVHSLEPVYIRISIKIFGFYSGCEIRYKIDQNIYQIQFQNISFNLEKSCVYDVKFEIWDDLNDFMVPF